MRKKVILTMLCGPIIIELIKYMFSVQTISTNDSISPYAAGAINIVLYMGWGMLIHHINTDHA